MKTCPQCKKTYPANFDVCSSDNAVLIMQASASADPMIGKELAGRFVLTEKIGQGGMGTVYKAIHTRMNRTCAIKLLTSDTGDNESAAARFNREAQMASKIDNPHAVVIYDFGEAEGGLLYLAMEYIEGEPLSRLLSRETRLSISRAVGIASQIGEALAAAHSRGIVHRDLKPDNVMIGRKGAAAEYVKVLDFGIAKPTGEDATDNLTKTGFVVGSPAYMSPEQLSGEKLDARSDVYSLALIVYEMLTGRLPFEGENQQAIMIKRITSEPLPLGAVLPSVAPLVERVVMSALARDQHARTPTVTRFANELVSAANEGAGGGDTGRMDFRATGENSQTVLIGAQPAAAESRTETERQPGPLAYVTKAAHTPPENVVTKPAQQTDQTVAQGQWKPAPQPSAVLFPPAAETPKQGSKTFLIIACVMMLFLVGAIIGGYFLYSHYSGLAGSGSAPVKPDAPAGPGPSAPPERSPEPATSAANDAAASANYESGKQHQNRASEMEQIGSPVAFREENVQAVEEYRKAIALRPNFPEAHLNLGVALYSLNRVDEAAAEYRVAIKQLTEAYGAPTSPAMSNYGLALFDLKQYREAADAFGEALKIDPNDYDLYAHRAFALQNAGEDDKAKADYNDYLKRAPKGSYALVVREILAGRAHPPADSGNH